MISKLVFSKSTKTAFYSHGDSVSMYGLESNELNFHLYDGELILLSKALESKGINHKLAPVISHHSNLTTVFLVHFDPITAKLTLEKLEASTAGEPTFFSASSNSDTDNNNDTSEEDNTEGDSDSEDDTDGIVGTTDFEMSLTGPGQISLPGEVPTDDHTHQNQGRSRWTFNLYHETVSVRIHNEEIIVSTRSKSMAEHA